MPVDGGPEHLERPLIEADRGGDLGIKIRRFTVAESHLDRFQSCVFALYVRFWSTQQAPEGAIGVADAFLGLLDLSFAEQHTQVETMGPVRTGIELRKL